jgi:hypothetical protein
LVEFCFSITFFYHRAVYAFRFLPCFLSKVKLSVLQFVVLNKTGKIYRTTTL